MTVKVALRIVAGAVIVSASMGFARMPASASSNTHRVTPHDELTMISRSACNTKCDTECISSAEHKNPLSPGATHGRGPHGCESIALECSYHSCAASATKPMHEIDRMVAVADVRGLRDALAEGNFVYVAERGVVQVVADCGTVLAQLPVARRQAVELGFE